MASSASVIAIVMLGFMLLMLVGGIVLIILSRGKGNPYPACGACGYDLSGTIGEEARCPECGADFAVAGIIAPGRKRNLAMLALGILLVLIPVTCIGITMVPLTVRQATPQPAPASAPTTATGNAETAPATSEPAPDEPQ